MWYPETGTAKKASFKAADGRTTVPLQLEPWGTVFVVFRKPTSLASRTVPEVTETRIATTGGPWNLSFQPERGAPTSITLDELSDWSHSEDAGVKYFSGVGTYTRTLQASPDWFKNGARYCIDLGDVRNLAVITVNGKETGEAGHAPYRVGITSELKPGAKDIAIKVVNAWANRLIGDEQPGATKLAFADVKPYKAGSPLLPSGLIGPVTVIHKDTH